MQWIEDNFFLNWCFFHLKKIHRGKEKLQCANSIITEAVVRCISLLINMALYLVESLFGSLIAHANRKSTDSVLSVCNY